jgi:hypothetical protein
MAKTVTLWDQFYNVDPKEKSAAQKTADRQNARISMASTYLKGNARRAELEAKLTQLRSKLGTSSYDVQDVVEVLAEMSKLTFTQKLMAEEFKATFGIDVEVIMDVLSASPAEE